MPISINGTGSITGLSAGGLPDASIVTADIADSAVTTAKVNDSAITAAKLAQPLTLATAQNSTSGTAIDFTGIPSWVKRISVILYRVSTNGASVPLVRIGTSGGIVSSGYESWAGYGASAGQNTSDTTGFILASTGAYGSSVSYSGIMTILNISGNNWVSSFSATSGIQVCGGGSVPLSATLDRIRITTVGGTDTFDAGSINIMYEG